MEGGNENKEDGRREGVRGRRGGSEKGRRMWKMEGGME